MNAAKPILSVSDLTIDFSPGSGRLPAVSEVTFTVQPGEMMCIVGESGSGKSVTALAIMGLLPSTARLTGGMDFDGRDLTRLSRRQWQNIRGREIGMIFQEPMTSLNPVFTIGRQLVESIRHHQRISPRAARARAVELLDKVGIPSPRYRLDDYPHQMSGGMRQRVMIAIALTCSPKLLVADEPTTALDVTIQGQLLDLLNQLREDTGTAIMLITHNMGVVAEVADRVTVMYSGQMAEQADVMQIFDRPAHPYTRGLMISTPNLITTLHRLTTIPGTMPNPAVPPPGCLFAPRCDMATPACDAGRPANRALSDTHLSACLRAEDLQGALTR